MSLRLLLLPCAFAAIAVSLENVVYMLLYLLAASGHLPLCSLEVRESVPQQTQFHCLNRSAHPGHGIAGAPASPSVHQLDHLVPAGSEHRALHHNKIDDQQRTPELHCPSALGTNARRGHVPHGRRCSSDHAGAQSPAPPAQCHRCLLGGSFTVALIFSYGDRVIFSREAHVLYHPTNTFSEFW